MKTSSAQLELNYGSEENNLADLSTAQVEHVARSQSANSSPLIQPEFAPWSGGLAAITARRAGRLNASAVSEAEHIALLNERNKLLDKEFSKTISRTEKNRLEYVRWSLDRIEDAKHGHDLDALEGLVAHYEQLSRDINSLKNQLVERLPKKRK